MGKPGNARLSTLLIALLLLTACVRQSPPTAPIDTHGEHVVQTMVTGIDQFDGGRVWGLNTGHGTFVVGPDVSEDLKSTLYEHLMQAHDQVVTIHYQDMPASRDTVAHKRVTAMIIQGTRYRLIP